MYDEVAGETWCGLYDEDAGGEGCGLYDMDSCQIIEKETGFLGEHGLRHQNLCIIRANARLRSFIEGICQAHSNESAFAGPLIGRMLKLKYCTRRET